MKTFLRLSFSVGSLLLIAVGCVPSLNPLYTKDTLIFDQALVGPWSEEPDSTEVWRFKKEGDKSYRATVTMDGKSAEFVVHLVKLGEKLFLDFFPESSTWEASDLNGFYKNHFMPTHTFYLVRELKPNLVMASLDPDWLKELLQRDSGAIAHHKVRDNSNDEAGIMLTASTAELQKFLLKYSDDKKAFGDGSKLVKRP